MEQYVGSKVAKVFPGKDFFKFQPRASFAIFRRSNMRLFSLDILLCSPPLYTYNTLFDAISNVGRLFLHFWHAQQIFYFYRAMNFFSFSPSLSLCRVQ